MKLTKFLALFCAASALFVACDPNDQNDPTPEPTPDPTGDLVLSVSPEVGEVGSPITFTVKQGDVDVTTMEDLEIYETENYTVVSNPFTPTIDGEYTFYAVLGPNVSNRVTVTVNAVAPVIPADTNPSSTTFNHRVLIIDHTGTNCGWCPYVMSALKQLSESDYHTKFHEAMAHTFNSNDPSYSSAARTVSSIVKKTNGYPEANINFYHNASIGGGSNVAALCQEFKNNIDKLYKANGADAGIAAAASMTSDSVLVSIDVKAAKEQDYRVACWLLEDKVEGKQAGAFEQWQNIHNNGIRNITGQRNSGDISGDDLGVIKAGDVVNKLVEVPVISQKWVRENLKILIIVTADNGSGKYDVVNTALCPIGGSVNYEYK